MSAEQNNQSRRAFKLQVWQMILLPIILALIPLLYPEIKALFMRKQPQFVIENPIIKKGDSVLHIFAENGPARKNEDLNIEVEGLEFRDAGKLIKNNPLEWEFNFTKYDIPNTLFTEGMNTIRIGFPSSVGYDELNVYVRPDFYQSGTPVATIEGPIIKAPTINKLDFPTAEIKNIQIISNAMDDDERVGVTESALRGAGIRAYGLMDKGHYKYIEKSEIRYFHDKDQQKAEEIADMIEKDLKIPLKVQKSSKGLPKKEVMKLQGHLEVVLSNS